MAVRITISISEEQQYWLNKLVKAGFYTNISEAIRAGVNLLLEKHGIERKLTPLAKKVENQEEGGW